MFPSCREVVIVLYRRWNSGRHHLQRPPAGRSHVVHFIPLLRFWAGGKKAADGTLPRRWLQAWRTHGLLNVWHGPGCAKRSTDFDSRWILVSKLLCLNITTPPTTNSHWHASDASSVLAPLPGISSCKSQVRVSSHQSMLERNSHTGGWPENQSWHRSQLYSFNWNDCFSFHGLHHTTANRTNKKEKESNASHNCHWFLQLLVSIPKHFCPVGSWWICPKRWLELVQTSLTPRLRAEHLVNQSDSKPHQARC